MKTTDRWGFGLVICALVGVMAVLGMRSRDRRK